jgi:beta-galactosidase
MKLTLYLNLLVFTIVLFACNKINNDTTAYRNVFSFNKDWQFTLGDTTGNRPELDKDWRNLNLPHDWSIEGEFNEKHPATPGGGALPGGIGWYRKTFILPEVDKNKLVFIDFDGVYRNSEVWINGNYLGKRPNGYISFRYELTSYLNFGEKQNEIIVKVDNSKQPNSRWYSGSGIYRNVWLTITDNIYINQWGTFITTPKVDENASTISVKTNIKNASGKDQEITVKTTIIDATGKKITSSATAITIHTGVNSEVSQELTLAKPNLWTLENPYLYKAISQVEVNGAIVDDYITPFGVRYFHFDSQKGFSLNGKPTKIMGVCNHHDLGCLGAAINTRALERQLEILKDMGCNGIRTSHNPPAPELLDLCDKMGFVVMDEAFDMWKKKKTVYDYSLDWDEWHKRDLEDLIRRDRNHPSVFIWSIGNEILEQWDSTGISIAKELAGIAKDMDSTRPITSGCNDPKPHNNIIKSGVLDLIGYNYHHADFTNFFKDFPGQKFIATETTSALATRGHYDMPSDSIRRWPIRWDLPFTTGNPDNTCSAYDNCSAPWGSTHEETWKIMKKHDYLSGMFIWTGFDYLGEPTPYSWPSRSSYFGIVDLAGFPKDAYYMYQSEWTNKPVLHIFPHWNWKQGDTIDIWAYSNADEVELFLDKKSLGVKAKKGEELHLMWKVPYKPGTLKAIAQKAGKEFLSKEIKTAGVPAKIEVSTDRTSIKGNGADLAFVTTKILDKDGNLVPNADNLVSFEISGEGFIAGVDNGNPVSHEPFKANYRKAFNGMCIAVIQSLEKKGKIKLLAKSENLEPASITIETK